MAELVCVYDAAPVPRTPEDVISTPAQKRRKKKAQARKPDQKGKPREPQARAKWLAASVTDDIPRGDRRRVRRGRAPRPAAPARPGSSWSTGTAPDGAVTAEAARRGVTIHVVIDFIHVLELSTGPDAP